MIRFLALIMELFAECGGVCNNDVNILGMIKSAKIVSSECYVNELACANRTLDWRERAEENR